MDRTPRPIPVPILDHNIKTSQELQLLVCRISWKSITFKGSFIAEEIPELADSV